MQCSLNLALAGQEPGWAYQLLLSLMICAPCPTLLPVCGAGG